MREILEAIYALAASYPGGLTDANIRRAFVVADSIYKWYH